MLTGQVFEGVFSKICFIDMMCDIIIKVYLYTVDYRLFIL